MKKYYLGLDLGTDSVGWAVTDENLEIVRKGGKSLWGVRLFDEAESAANRRTNRTTRRRLQRRKQRITLLQDIFQDEMNKVDPMFFRKMELSKYHFEDRNQYFNSKTILFSDDKYTDREYYKQYPTIYHLRKDLINNPDKKFDIRLIYLAIHHLIKYRGNFLTEGDFDVNGNDYENIINNINEIIEQINIDKVDDKGIIEKFDTSKNKELVDEFKKTSGIKKTEEALQKVFSTKNSYTKKVICKLLSGATVKVKDIFELENDEEIDIKSISFSSNYDETIEKIHSEGFEDCTLYFDLIDNLYRLYSSLSLKRLLNDCDYLCDAMCNIYDEHSKDLKLLKKYVKTCHSSNKQKIFGIYFIDNGKKGKTIDEKVCNYAKYIGSTINGGKMLKYKKCTIDEFYSFLKKELDIKKDSDNEDAKLIFDKMEKATFLRVQNSSSNGIFPYQLNEKELNKIIENQSKFYPELFNKIDEEYNISNAKKINDLLKFRVPYYVGPLAQNKNNNTNFWMERKESGKIYPWNFDEKVDKDKSAKKFIERMQNKCTYLHSEFTLPKNSLIYQEYNLYNNLNKMAIDGKLITYEQKEDIVENLFNKKIVKKKDLEEYVKEKYNKKLTYFTGNEIEAIQYNLKSLLDFNNILGEKYVKENRDTIEDIIRDIVVFEDRSILKKRLSSEYGITDEKIIKKILNLKYKDYGRLSKKLLVELRVGFENKDTGELIEANILYWLKHSNLNFMEIINYEDVDGNKPFIDLINEENDEIECNDPEKYIEQQYVSPGMKRTLIQAYKIIKEIEDKILKQKIDKYYIECTRTNKSPKKRSDSRLDKLIALYNDATDICEKELSQHLTEDKEKLSNELEKDKKNGDDEKYRSDKLYLYYSQMGKSMYSQKPIDIKDVYNTKICDIDHIIPQSLIKDDSIDNRVLVFLDENREKSNIYPLPDKYRTVSNEKYYDYLLDNKFISKEKHKRLIRTNELSEDEINAFDNRQLVYTSQAVKALADTLRQFDKVDNNKVVLVKGEQVSEFRKINNFVKCRSLNDLHHAHDAYLNVVVGYCLYTGGKQHLVGRSEILKGKVDLVKKTLQNGNYRHDILVTTRQYIGNILMNKISVQSNKANGTKNASELFPIKNDSNGIKMYPEKYGGYTSLANGYYCLVKSKDKKGKEIISIEPMQNMFIGVNASIEEKERYLRENVGLIEPHIMKDINDKEYLDKIKINFVVQKDSGKYCITGKTGNQLVIKCLTEAYYPSEMYEIVHKMDKIMKKISDMKVVIKKGMKSEDFEKIIKKIEIKEEDNKKKITVSASNKYSNYDPVYLSDDELNKVYEELINQMNKNIYDIYTNIQNIKDELNKRREKFIGLDMIRKIQVLTEIIKLLSCKRMSADLRFIDMSENSGVLLISKKDFNGKIINESITGYFTKVIYDGTKQWDIVQL